MSDDGKINITIKSGPTSRKLAVDKGSTVDQIRAEYGERLRLDGQHQPYVSTQGNASNKSVDGATTLDDGQTLEFMRNTGQKG